MTDRADEETPQFVTFQPCRIRIAIVVVLIVVAAALVPEGPYLLTTGPVFVVGCTALSFAVHRSVVLSLGDHAVEIRQCWRKQQQIPYEQITEAAVGPRTEWWRIGRRRLTGGATGYLMGGPSVRINTEEMPVVVSAEGSCRVVGAMRRQMEPVAEGRGAGTEQAGR